MNKTVQRLLLFFIGIPIILLIVLADFWNHFPFHAAVLLFALLSVQEMHNMLKSKFSVHSLWLLFILAGIIPISEYAVILLNLEIDIITITFVCSILLLMFIEIFNYDKETGSFDKALGRICTSSFIIFYCSYLFSFISRMGEWRNFSALITFFLITVFGSDSFAWLFGVLLGRNNKNIFKASPNKSIAGYVGSFAGPLAIAYLLWYFIPLFHEFDLWKVLLISFTTSFTSISGDLVESVIKRSANCKDSGKLIPGRGGILDSIDSILFSAPLFYLLSELLFGL